MKAIILAAGRGERLRPLTDTCPKPLLHVRGKRLIEWHLEALARAGVHDVVVNTAWLEEQFPAALGDGSRYGLRLRFSMEGRDHGGALDTAGGIVKALPLLGDLFWVVSGDVFLPDFDFARADGDAFATSANLGLLWLVPPAPHHPDGDFGIDAHGSASRSVRPRLKWASVGLFRAGLFKGMTPGVAVPLAAPLDVAAAAGRLAGKRWDGTCIDVGTIDRLNSLNQV
ncbi:MAG TPA: sugar phosphate nucleotidyltransferase [Burkholderiaceae bacterium]|jgi:MurNAc alpha-1-phosphate uridylyltransferase|nr:sugar phosphate nucleotidyltransferase [Burkholderiaceae bacterium]